MLAVKLEAPMSATESCRACGAEIPGNAPFGHCPRCLLDLGLCESQEPWEGPSPTDKHQQFGDYELIEELGHGGMGIVHKAKQLSLNRLVAIKRVNAGKFASAMLIQRFHREAQAAAQLHHPNIVSIYEIGELQGEHFYSMQLIAGTGLDRHIGPLGFNCAVPNMDPRETVRARQEVIASIVAKVARAVGYAHQNRVLHRDIKPSNIVLDDRGEPYLTDFGVAKVLGLEASSLTASVSIVGSLHFMAPEQAAGDSKRITAAADTYSLGAVLYTMLTGTPPHKSDTTVEMFRKIAEEEPKHPSTLMEDLDSDLATIAMKCLEKEPRQRYASAFALAEDLERWLAGDAIQARPIQKTERFLRWCRKNPKVTTLLACLTLLLIGISIGSTLVAMHIQRLNDSVSNVKQWFRSEVLDNLAKVYSDPNTTSYTIKAEVRHTLLGRRLVPEASGDPLELTLVDYVYGHPTNILSIFAPILETLEWDLANKTRRPVAIDLLILKSYDLGYDDLERGRMTFGRVGPASFSQLLDKATGVELLAMQDQTRPLTLALFTATNNALGRASKEQPTLSLAALLTNRSMAFGNIKSTTGNHVPRWFLATNGVYAANLSRYQHLKSHQEVLEAVQSGRFDVGAVNEEVLRNRLEFQVVARYAVGDLGRCWVAGRGLDREIFAAIRDSLLRMKDPAIIGRIESEVNGFKVVDEQALSRLREIMHGAAAFDSRIQHP